MPKQEPVAWMETYKGEPNNVEFTRAKLDGWSDYKEVVPLYTHPKQWQGLSDDEIEEVYEKVSAPMGERRIYEVHTLAKAIEAKLKEKNEK
jgi:hypothetical protein